MTNQQETALEKLREQIEAKESQIEQLNYKLETAYHIAWETQLLKAEQELTELQKAYDWENGGADEYHREEYDDYARYDEEL